MKKLLLSLVVALCALSLSAQDWSVGGRVGSGFQAVAQYRGFNTSSPFYVEGRFGMSWAYDAFVTADFTALAAWNCFNFAESSKGEFFSDFGAGINVGGRADYCYVGPCGLARIGYNFARVPLSLSADWTPVLGAEFSKKYILGSHSSFYESGLYNFAVTLVYNF